MAILQISASGSPTVPSSGSAPRLRSSLRFRSTVPPRVQLGRQLAPPTAPLALLSCPSIDLRRSNEPSGLTFNSAVSLHRRLSFRFCCSCPPFDLRRPTSLRASPSIESSAFAADPTSGSASWLSSGLRHPSADPPHLQHRWSACAANCTFGSAFLHAVRLAPNRRAFQPRLRIHPQLAPPMEPPALPSCVPFDLRRAAGLPALPFYLTADFPAAFLFRRCPRFWLRLSPPLRPRTHPSDSNFRHKPTVASLVFPSDQLLAFALINLPAFPSNFPIRQIGRAHV